MRDLCLCVDLGCLCGKFVKFMCRINPGCMYKHEKDERIEILELRRHEAPQKRWVSSKKIVTVCKESLCGLYFIVLPIDTRYL